MLRTGVEPPQCMIGCVELLKKGTRTSWKDSGMNEEGE